MEFKTTSKDPFTVSLSGPISEAMEGIRGELTQLVTSGPNEVHIDIGEITSINSIGVSHWITFLKGLPVDRTIRLQRCPSVFIDYLNMVPEVAFRAKVASLQVPYECKNCGHAWTQVMTAEELAEVEDFGKAVCGSCGNESGSTEEAEDYLFFLGEQEDD